MVKYSFPDERIVYTCRSFCGVPPTFNYFFKKSCVFVYENVCLKRSASSTLHKSLIQTVKFSFPTELFFKFSMTRRPH